MEHYVYMTIASHLADICSTTMMKASANSVTIHAHRDVQTTSPVQILAVPTARRAVDLGLVIALLVGAMRIEPMLS